jgi:predicted GNAT superfamily acetyltransferase
VSRRFHESLGFFEVGRQETYGGSVTVQLLERRLVTEGTTP